MDVAFNIRSVSLGLLLIFSGQGSIHAEAQPSTSGTKEQVQKKSSAPSPQPAEQESPSPDSQSKPEPSSTPNPVSGSTPTAEPTESFSQLTLFLFGSGLALFIALLGWSDQIRGIDKDTKELEKRFLAETKIDKQDFLSIVKPKSPDDQLVALTQVMTSGRISTDDSAELLRTFHTWNGQWSAIERLSSWKYNLTLTLTIMLFLTGLISLFTNSTQRIQTLFGSVRTEIALVSVPMLLVGLLLIIIICSSRREKMLRNLLESISDKV